jgi:hypothetical protein
MKGVSLLFRNSTKRGPKSKMPSGLSAQLVQKEATKTTDLMRLGFRAARPIRKRKDAAANGISERAVLEKMRKEAFASKRRTLIILPERLIPGPAQATNTTSSTAAVAGIIPAANTIEPENKETRAINMG